LLHWRDAAVPLFTMPNPTLLNYLEYRPHTTLRDSVRSYWSLEEFHSAASETHSFFPEPTVRLVFYQGEAFLEQPSGEFAPLSNVYVIGFQSRSLGAISRGLTRALGVEFYPWGALRLLGLQQGLQGVYDVQLGAEYARLAAQIDSLLGSADLPAAVEVLEDWLLKRAQNVSLEATPAVQAGALLYAAGGQVRITDIADQVGVSLRQLQRSFNQEVGITPKTLARIIRFEGAHNKIWLEPKRDLSQLAFELGYADQAHLTREFQALAQVTPAVFSRGVLNRTDHQPSPVAFLQAKADDLTVHSPHE
jgi:AraC-like DNA-binding protein